MPSTWLLIVHAAATWFMVGLIWFVQVVHYPLFDAGPADEGTWHRRHTRRTGWVVGGPMLLEAVTAVWLVVSPPAGVPVALAWLGLAMLAGVWASTVLWQVPRHSRLEQGFDAATHTALVRSNWLRTLLWSARGALVLVLLSG